jgi:hypothetical protein
MANLTQLVKQLRAERDRLDRAIAALGGVGRRNARRERRRGRRKLSQEARNRIAAAQRARWAKMKAKKTR